MQCPECGAELREQREFCPKCGTPLHRSLRRRAQAAPGAAIDPDLKRNRRRALAVGVVILLALGSIGKISWFDGPIHINTDHGRGQDRGGEDRNAPAIVQAQQLFDAYQRDEDAADEEYDGREMVVTGEFVRIAPDSQGDPDLRLKTSDPNAPLGVDLIRASHGSAAQLRPGQTITVSCERVDRTGDERWLRNCAIQNVAEATPGSAPSPAPAAKSAPPAAPAAASPPPAVATPPSPPAPPSQRNRS